jgi:hypothetical protein
VEIQVRDVDAPGEDPYAELMPEVLPGPEVLPEDEPAVDRAPLSLQRLLDRAKPSLAEAVSLAALVLEALAVMHENSGAHGRLDSRSIRLTPACTVRIAGRSGREGRDGTSRDLRRADIEAAAAIVAEIDKAAGRPNRALSDREERLSARLAVNADVRSLSRRGLRKAARGLEQAVGRADQREAARQGVAGLVRAVSGYDAPSGSNGAAFGGPVNGAPLARRLPPPAPRPPLWPRIWKPLTVAAAVLLVVGGWVQLFGGTARQNIKTLLSGDAQAAAEPTRLAPLPDLGPPASGAVTHLELRALEGCRAEQTCSAVLQLAVTPQTSPLEVTWNFELLDRCGPLREARPGGVLSVAPGADRAVQTVAVALPPGQALTLIPVTTAPVRVAGAPMPLYPPDRAC